MATGQSRTGDRLSAREQTRFEQGIGNHARRVERAKNEETTAAQGTGVWGSASTSTSTSALSSSDLTRMSRDACRVKDIFTQ